MRPLGSATGGSTWFLRANPRPRRDVREAGAHVFKFQGRSDFGVAIFVSWNLRDPQLLRQDPMQTFLDSAHLAREKMLDLFENAAPEP